MKGTVTSSLIIGICILLPLAMHESTLDTDKTRWKPGQSISEKNVLKIITGKSLDLLMSRSTPSLEHMLGGNSTSLSAPRYWARISHSHDPLPSHHCNSSQYIDSSPAIESFFFICCTLMQTLQQYTHSHIHSL